MIVIIIIFIIIFFMFYKMSRDILNDMKEFDKEAKKVCDEWLKTIKDMEK